MTDFNLTNVATSEQQAIDSLTTSSTNESLLLAAMTPNRSAIQCTVPTTDDLPDLTVDTDIPDGFMVYVEDIGIPVIAVGTEWQLVNGIPYMPTAKNILWTWGQNLFRQLGTDDTLNRSSPATTAGGGTNWSQISAGENCYLAIKSDGTLWAWGLNNYEILGIETPSSIGSPVTVAGGGSNWTQVSASYNFYSAIKTDGTLWTWGDNAFGQLGNNSTDPRISPETIAGGGTNWSQVSSSALINSAIKTDGTLWTWGHNDFGSLGDGTTISRSSPGTTAGGGTTWKQVSAGSTLYISAIKTDGTLWVWGYNNFGQLGDNTTTNRSSPITTAGGGTTWNQVSAGGYQIAAIKTDGTLWTWGNNNFGQLGIANTINRSSPGTVAGGGTNWSQVSTGDEHIAAIKTDGTLWTWGRNYMGKLGDGTTVNRSSPVTTAGGGTNWILVNTRSKSTAAIRLVVS